MGCALAFQARESSSNLEFRSNASVSPFATNEDKGNWTENAGSNPVWGSILTTKELNMNIKTFMAAAVIALTAACTPASDAPAVAEAAGPAADEALATANATEEAAEAPLDAEAAAPAAEPALGENEQPK